MAAAAVFSVLPRFHSLLISCLPVFFCDVIFFFCLSVLVFTFIFRQAAATEAVCTELGVRSSDYAIFNIAILVLVTLYMP